MISLSLWFAAPAWASRCVGDFETGDLSQWHGVHALPGDIAVVTSPVRQGRYAAWFHVDQDSLPFAELLSNRAHISKRTGESRGHESWWTWSTYFTGNFTPNLGSDWNSFMEWHHETSRFVAPISFGIDTRVTPWQIALHAWGGPPRIDPIYQEGWHLTPFERNKWYDFVFHVKWGDTAQSGFVEVWINGEPVLPLAIAATLYRGESVYIKQGFYRNVSSYTAELVHDGLRRGSSYQDLRSLACNRRGRPLLRFARLPRVLPGRRLAIRARAPAGRNVAILVRNRFGRLLGRARARANDRGLIRRSVELPRWRGGRILRVTLAAGSAPPTTSTLLLSPR